MTHDLRRPAQFGVLPARSPTLGVVNQQESARINQRKRHLQLDLVSGGDTGEDNADQDCCDGDNDSAQLPVGVLPVVRCARPQKIGYVATPAKTPKYFRWKPQRPDGPPALSIKSWGSPITLSPRVQRQSDSEFLDGKHPVSSRDWLHYKPNKPGSSTDVPDDFAADVGEIGPFEDDHTVLPVIQVSASIPGTPRNNNFLFDDPEPLPPVSPPSSSARPPPVTPAIVMRRRSDILTYEDIPAPSPPQSHDSLKERAVPAEEDTDIPAEEPTTPDSPAPFFFDSSRYEVPFAKSNPSQHSNEQSARTTTSHEGSNEVVHEDKEVPSTNTPLKSSSAASIVLRTHQGQPQDKVISHHVLRGAFLRKYLHVSNIARKLKETEQQLQRSAAMRSGQPKRPPEFRSAASLRNNRLDPETANNTNADSGSSSPVPSLRRVSSIDESINKTVKRIRRLSGVETNATDEMARNSTPSPSPSPSEPKRKMTSMIPIVEGAAVLEARNKNAVGGRGPSNGDDDLEIDREAEVKLDPTSSHMLRICQHVIAKRAVKSFLRQEMAVITQVEASLRDDPGLQRRPSSPSKRNASSDSADSSDSAKGDTAGSSGSPPTEVPIKSMNSDLVEAVTVYLKEGDQHMTTNELYGAALLAESDKSWKRAIMLASACVVIDNEFLLAALLRARCCRRIGLWTQAVKDLSLAIALRPDEPKLLLLRACIYVKVGDLDSALADVSRGLLLHPKSTEALLLRADIFHRQRAIAQSLQDLTNVLALDPSCWRAYYDRATLRIRAVEGDEPSLIYHWEHMTYGELLTSIIQDYVNALRQGCKMIEVVETIGDLAIRLLEFTADPSVLRQVIQNFSHLLQILAHDHRGSFFQHSGSTQSLGSSSNAADRSSLDRELLTAAIHAQRGRLYVLYNDKDSALVDFDHAVVMEYHYPVAHFYRGAFATLVAKDDAADPAALKANMQHLTRCIALDPTIAGAYTVRGALHLRDLQFNSALQDFKAAVATDPTLYEVWLQIALVYLNHYHDSDECIKACCSALTNDSCLARALYLRGEAYTRQGNIRAALRDYGRLTIAQPNDRWAQLMRGRLLLQLKLPRPALYCFILFMTQGDTANKSAHVLCGRAYKILSRFKDAVSAFQRAVTLNPTSENLVLLSESLHSMGDTENSLRVSDKVISADPGSFKGYVRRAQLLVSTQHFAQALAEYDKAMFLAPKEGRVLYERGIVQLQLYLHWRRAFQVHFDTRRDANGRSRALLHPDGAATINLELVLGANAIKDEAHVRKMMKQYYAGSLADLTKCIRLEPTMAEPYIDRAELFTLDEDFDKAFRDFDSAIERNPACARAYVNLGVLKCQLSGFAAAIGDFDEAAKCDPRLALALFNRGVAYQRLMLWKQAEKSYDQSIALFGADRSVDAHRNRAVTRCQLGDYSGALSDLNAVRESAPDDDELHGALGFALLQLGRYEAAASSFAAYGRLSRDTFADSGNAYFSLGARSEDHIDQKKHEQHLRTALRFYLRAARIHPSNLDIRLNMANCLRNLGDVERAIAQCDSIRIAHPQHHASIESKALALYQIPGRLEDAVECMGDAIRACVASSASLENIFYAFSSSTIRRNALERRTVHVGRHETGRPSNGPLASSVSLTSSPIDQLLETAAGVSASAPPASSASEIVVNGSHKQMLSLYLTNRGVMLERLGQLDKARQDYNDAIHFDVLSVHAFVCLGTLNLVEGLHADAVAALQRALALDPGSGVAHINLGVAYLCLHREDDALAEFDAATAALPSCSYGHANKAVALSRRGSLADAERCFKRAIEELPSRHEYYLARGKIVAQQKRLQDAMGDFATALFLGYEGKL